MVSGYYKGTMFSRIRKDGMGLFTTFCIIGTVKKGIYGTLFYIPCKSIDFFTGIMICYFFRGGEKT